MKMVYNGSRLGKEFSANKFQERFGSADNVIDISPDQETSAPEEWIDVIEKVPVCGPSETLIDEGELELWEPEFEIGTSGKADHPKRTKTYRTKTSRRQPVEPEEDFKVYGKKEGKNRKQKLHL